MDPVQFAHASFGAGFSGVSVLVAHLVPSQKEPVRVWYTAPFVKVAQHGRALA